MGEIAEDMVDGTCCCLCGCYFKDKQEHLFTHDYPAVCWDCWGDLTEDEKESYQRAEVETF